MGSPGRLSQVSVAVLALLVIIVIVVLLKMQRPASGMTRGTDVPRPFFVPSNSKVSVTQPTSGVSSSNLQVTAKPLITTQTSLPSQSADRSGFSQNGFIPDEGKENKCCDAIKGRQLEEICYYDGMTPPASTTTTKNSAPKVLLDKSECSCADYFLCKLVVVSSVSSNHMTEAKKMIKLVHEHLPNTKIIMNSLGLTNAEMDYLKSQRNVEFRIFNFDKYPSMAFSKHNLFTYAWKPMVVKEASEKYEVIMYFDSSVRLNGSIDAGVFKYLQVYPGVVLGPWYGNNCYNTNRPIVSYTNNGMLKYLFPEKAKNIAALRKELAPVGHRPGGCWLMWMNSELKKKLLDSWADCALHQECIAPSGVTIWNCKVDPKHNYTADGAYIGCHRYDQSAMNLILYREFGMKYIDNFCLKFVFDLFPIQRW